MDSAARSKALITEKGHDRKNSVVVRSAASGLDLPRPLSKLGRPAAGHRDVGVTAALTPFARAAAGRNADALKRRSSVSVISPTAANAARDRFGQALSFGAAGACAASMPAGAAEREQWPRAERERAVAALLRRTENVQTMTLELERRVEEAQRKLESALGGALAALCDRWDRLSEELRLAAAAKAHGYDLRSAQLYEQLRGLADAGRFAQTAVDICTGSGVGGAGAAGEAARPLAIVDRGGLNRLPVGDDEGGGVGGGGGGDCLENCYLDFVIASEPVMRRLVSQLGKIAVSDVCVEQSTASGQGLRRCSVGRPTVVLVTLRNKDGAVVGCNVNDLVGLIYKGNVSVEAHVRPNERGSYDVAYMVPEPGSYTLSIGLFKQQIRDSPFKVKAFGRPVRSLTACALSRTVTSAREVEAAAAAAQRKPAVLSSPRSERLGRLSSRRWRVPNGGDSSYLLSFSTASSSVATPARPSDCAPATPDDGASAAMWTGLLRVIGCRGGGAGELENPQGVCAGRDDGGSIVVTDGGNQSVQVFSAAGKLLRRFFERGRFAGQLLRPTGVAVTRAGGYVVADYENRCVNLYSADWKFRRRVGEGKLLGPKGVAVTPSGEIVVADSKANAVLVFDKAGKVVRRLGEGAGTGHDGEWKLSGPHYVACTANGDILVTDFHSHCVKRYDRTGKYVRSFGSVGDDDGQFDMPTGIAVDGQGNIIVADWGNSRVQVFDHAETFVCRVNVDGSPLIGPQGLAVVVDGTVAVSDSGNHCVKLLEY